MIRYRLAVGHQHGVKPGNIVGAIANEAGLENQYIGRVDIRDDYSLIDLPDGMPREVLRHLKTVWVVGQQLQIRPDGSPFAGGAAESREMPRKKGKLGKPKRST
jgi:ATP-dependent RNA helicase DeaD